VPLPADKEVLTLEGNKISQSNKQSNKVLVYLEDIDLSAKNSAELQPWCDLLAENVFAEDAEWQKIFKSRFALVSDDVFTFLCETGTEVVARIRIEDDTKIVKDGALWYEESLPVETILAGVVWCDRVYGSNGGGTTSEQLMDEFCKKPYDLQIGGKASTGKGRVRCVFSGGRQCRPTINEWPKRHLSA
jgi:CRISPR-associated protein Cmr4